MPVLTGRLRTVINAVHVQAIIGSARAAYTARPHPPANSSTSPLGVTFAVHSYNYAQTLGRDRGGTGEGRLLLLRQESRVPARETPPVARERKQENRPRESNPHCGN